MFMRVSLACLPVILVFATGLAAQMKMHTAQCSSGWEWNQNSLGQDPCTIATMLGANCHSDANYSYSTIGLGECYNPPMKAYAGDMTCDCNSVVYSLAMACSTCQGGVAYSWNTWTKQCNATEISSYPNQIPQGTAIPYWAFYNVTRLSEEKFNNSNAQSVGRNPEVGSTSPTASSNIDSGGATTIIGGVVGALGSFIVVSIIAYFGFQRWRKDEGRRNRGKGIKVQQQQHTSGYDINSGTPHHSPAYSPDSSRPTLVLNHFSNHW